MNGQTEPTPGPAEPIRELEPVVELREMRGTAELRRAILARTAPVVVLGQGYVGLSLACATAEAGFPVVGIDTDAERLEGLAEGRLTVPGLGSEVFESALAQLGRLSFSAVADTVATARLIFICVPTPLNKTKEPDNGFIMMAAESLKPQLHKDMLIVLESTTFPGFTREILLPKLQESGLKVGEDFFLCFSPERVDPGNEKCHDQEHAEGGRRHDAALPRGDPGDVRPGHRQPRAGLVARTRPRW